jgi:hypothetical protein
MITSSYRFVSGKKVTWPIERDGDLWDFLSMIGPEGGDSLYFWVMVSRRQPADQIVSKPIRRKAR